MSNATLNELINRAENEGFILKSHAARLHKIRKFRNTLEHTRDISDGRMRMFIAPSLFSTRYQHTALLLLLVCTIVLILIYHWIIPLNEKNDDVLTSCAIRACCRIADNATIMRSYTSSRN